MARGTDNEISQLGHGLAVAGYAVAAALIGPGLAPLVAAWGPPEGLLAAAVIFLALVLVHGAVLCRAAARALDERQRRDAADIAELRRQMLALRADLEDIERAGAERLAAEMRVLKTLLGQLAERMSPRRPLRASRDAAHATADAAGERRPGEGDLLGAVQQALEDNRIDLYLQPVVSLPQRKVRFYEAFSRIRDADGEILAPEDYLPVAERGGLITTIDNLLLFRCVQLIRQLRRRNRVTGFFVNISALTLEDEDFFRQFADFLAVNGDLADSLFFEFSHRDLVQLVPAGEAALERLAGLGFRLSLDQVLGLDVDGPGLARRGFRFVKIDGATLLSSNHQAEASIDVADLKQALARSGIDLIVEKIETEQMLVDLLDFDVDYGQGWLFGEPRRSRELA